MALLKFLSSIPSYFLWGLCLMYGWNWFIAPCMSHCLTIQILDMPLSYAIGMIYFIRMVIFHITTLDSLQVVKLKEDDQYQLANWLALFVSGYVQPIITIGIMKVIQLLS